MLLLVVVFVEGLVLEVDVELRFGARELDWLEFIAWFRGLGGTGN